VLNEGYILFENNGTPAAEFRWGAHGKNFQPEILFERLARKEKKGGVIFMPRDLPVEWRGGFPSFIVRGFSWDDTIRKGRGVMLYCQECGAVSLVRFFSHVPRKTAGRVLASYQDHPAEELVAWTVFDLDLRVPKEHILVRRAFRPGWFELSFRHGKEIWSYFRAGPAGALLQGKTLATWGEERLPGWCRAYTRPVLRLNQADAVEWSARPGAGALARLQAGIVPGPAFFACRVWRAPEKNRILAVCVNGRKDTEQERFEAACANHRLR
jgi:hypothetical protein